MPPMTVTGARRAGAGESRGIDWTLAYVLLAAVGVVTLLAMATAPVADLLGDSRYAIPSTLHGVSAMVYLVVGTISAYLAWKLYRGELTQLHDVRILSALNTFFAAITLLFGNWIYIYYRAPGGPRAYFLENAPALHAVFFEFKEFMALFTLPLAAAATFVLWREGDALSSNVRLRQAVAVVLGLAWLYLMLTFGLGAAITKLRSV